MKYFNIFLIVFFVSANGICQQGSSQDSVKFYVKNLSWRSFSLTPTYRPSLVLSYDAQAILNNVSDTCNLTSLLLKGLDEADKAVSSHIILSKLYEPENSKFSESYVYKSDAVIAINYLFNGLKWGYAVDSKSYVVNDEAIAWAKRYWVDWLSVHKK